DAAELYERYPVRYILGPWAQALVARTGLKHDESVLDVACGTGVIARLAAHTVGPTGCVTGLDLNAGMLAVARSLPAPSGAPITWIEGSAVAMNLPNAAFDVVFCQQGLQFVDAAFRDVAIEACRMNTRLPAVDRFVLAHLAATPVAGAVAAASIDA